jgi:hypothetical protein
MEMRGSHSTIDSYSEGDAFVRFGNAKKIDRKADDAVGIMSAGKE